MGARQWLRTPFARRLMVIAIFALVWRLIYVQLELHYLVLTDEAWYIGQAHQLFGAHPWTDIFYNFYPTAQHGPLTSVLVSPFAWLFPHALAGLRNVMAVVGTGTVIMMGLAGRKLGGDRVGLIAAIIAAGFPDFWIRDGLVVSEPVAAFLVATAVWITLCCREKVTTTRAIALGALIGLVTLARPEIAPALALVAAVVLWRPSPGRLVRLVLVVVVAGVMIAPWTIYNAGRFQSTVLVTNNVGITLAGANCHLTYYSSEFIGYDAPACWVAAQSHASRVSTDESVQSSVMRREATTYVAHHLSRVPLVVAMREM